MYPALATALTILGSFGASVALTWLARGWLARRRVLDAPNERSLHRDATVTGGGVAIAVVLLGLWLCLQGMEDGPGASLLIPVAALTLLGLLDDIYNLTWPAKLSLQVLVAVAFLAAAGPFTRVELFGLSVDSPPLSILATLVWIVALVNIYNFMDGIDGLVSGCSAVGACVLGTWFVVAGAAGPALFMQGLMAACLGFLVWNWAPARIFLGDAGSTMLGGTLAAMAVVGQRDFDMPLGAFVLLYGVFIADTGYTLARRALRGEKVWRPHREHLYQRAVQTGLRHSSVAGVILLISAIMCIPATLEMARVDPRILWPALSLLVVFASMVVIRKRESTNP